MSERQDGPTEAWTICIHATSNGDYDRAQDIAAAMEKLGRRRGAKDIMIEILSQHEPRLSVRTGRP